MGKRTGNPRGRPKGTTMRYSFSKFIEESDIKSAVAKLRELAEGGDIQAIKFLIEQGCGKPVQPVEGNLDTNLTINFKV